MEDPGNVTYIPWVMCDICFRAFKDPDKLIAHKKETHSAPPLAQSSNTKVNSRTTKRKIVNENPNGEKRKCGRPRKTKPGVNKTKTVKKEEQSKPESSSSNLKASSSATPPLPSSSSTTTKSVKITNSPSLSRSPSTSPTKAAKITECNRLLSAFHNPKSFNNKNNRPKNKSKGPTSKKPQTIKSSSTLSNANKSSQGEKIRCPQCYCELQSKGALKMHMGLHNAILIIPNSSSSNRKPQILSSSSSTASSSLSTASFQSNVKQSASFLVKNKPIQCKKCHKILIEPPFNCIDCVGSKIVFDIPLKNSKVLIKQESVVDNTEDMDTQILYINNNNNQVSEKNKNLVAHTPIENNDQENGKDDSATNDDDDDVLPIEVISSKKFAQIEVIDVY